MSNTFEQVLMDPLSDTGPDQDDAKFQALQADKDRLEAENLRLKNSQARTAYEERIKIVKDTVVRTNQIVRVLEKFILMTQSISKHRSNLKPQLRAFALVDNLLMYWQLMMTTIEAIAATESFKDVPELGLILSQLREMDFLTGELKFLSDFVANADSEYEESPQEN